MKLSICNKVKKVTAGILAGVLVINMIPTMPVLAENIGIVFSCNNYDVIYKLNFIDINSQLCIICHINIQQMVINNLFYKV